MDRIWPTGLRTNWDIATRIIGANCDTVLTKFSRSAGPSPDASSDPDVRLTSRHRVRVHLPDLMSSRTAAGDGRPGRSKKKAKYESLSGDEVESERVAYNEEGDYLIYDYVPNRDLGDIVMGM